MDCWAKALFGGPCDLPIQKAHIGFRKQTLRKRGMSEEQVWDGRIWRSCCWSHHQRLDSANFHLYWDQLPESVKDFAREHDEEFNTIYILKEADRRAGPPSYTRQPKESA